MSNKSSFFKAGLFICNLILILTSVSIILDCLKICFALKWGYKTHIKRSFSDKKYRLPVTKGTLAKEQKILVYACITRMHVLCLEVSYFEHVWEIWLMDGIPKRSYLSPPRPGTTRKWQQPEVKKRPFLAFFKSTVITARHVGP